MSLLTSARTAMGIVFDPDIRAQYFLRQSQRAFRGVCDEYWKSLRPDRAVALRPEEHDAIRENGFVIVPNYVEGELLAALQAEIEALSGLRQGAYTGPQQFKDFPNDGICALEITEVLPVSFALIHKNEHIDRLAKSLYGPQMALSASSILCKYGIDKIDSANNPHWDDWRARFKAFFYVYDVDEETAPTLYARGSHRRNTPPWRLEYDFSTKYMSRASGSLPWWTVHEQGYEIVKCTGKAGTLVLLDTTGIHAGSPLLRGTRVMLMAMFTTHMPLKFRPY
jgi:hypothetical protein